MYDWLDLTNGLLNDRRLDYFSDCEGEFRQCRHVLLKINERCAGGIEPAMAEKGFILYIIEQTEKYRPHIETMVINGEEQSVLVMY